MKEEKWYKGEEGESMSVFKEFEDYKDEIELVYIQNSGVEYELYSIIATMIKELGQSSNISLRVISSRRTTKRSKRLKVKGGFPDFVVLSREKQEVTDI